MGFFHSDSRQAVGNTDPDADPASTVYVQPLRIP